MARMSKLDSIDNQIKKKQEKLFELKAQSDAIADEIQSLVKEKELLQRETILETFENSGRTYEEIIEFLKATPKRTQTQPKEKRKYKPRQPKTID